MSVTPSNFSRERRYGLVDPARIAGRSGLELLRAMIDGELPGPPIARTLGFDLDRVEDGSAVFRGTPAVEYYNPLGSVHGGWVATLLDSCMACAVHSTLAAGRAYTTLEFKIDILRPVTVATGEVEAAGHVVRAGRRVAVAEGALTDRAGRLLARGTTTCLVFDAEEIAEVPGSGA